MSSEKTKAPTPNEVPVFDDDLDFIEWAENNDTSVLLAPENEISPRELKATRRVKRQEWESKSPAEKAKIKIGEDIRAQLLVRELRQAEFARLLGKDRAWVTRVVQGQENLTIETLSHIAEVLGCEFKFGPVNPVENKSNVVTVRKPSIAKSKAPVVIGRK